MTLLFDCHFIVRSSVDSINNYMKAGLTRDTMYVRANYSFREREVYILVCVCRERERDTGWI